jgi:hypothetical protein
MQAVPSAINTDIIGALHLNGDRFNSPDSLYGYGIPNMAGVVSRLQEILVTIPDNETAIGPNPTTGDVGIIFKNTPGTIKLLICTSSGQVVVNRTYNDFVGRSLTLSDLQDKQQGIYFITLITSEGTFNHKIIKLNN